MQIWVQKCYHTFRTLTHTHVIAERVISIKTDIDIAQATAMQPIQEIADKLSIQPQWLEPYGRYKAKVDWRAVQQLADKPDGKLVLVTAITPTPAGEGKTTTSVGLGDGLARLGQNVVIALREPSLGPVFGMKGGAAGGGYAQVVPMEDINLHFTGDLHAITAANNLLAAMLDNHIHQGNALGIDPRRVTWQRCMDINDRQLRQIVDGLGGTTNGYPREDGFDITVASEVMAILCLATDMDDLKERLGRVVVAWNTTGEPVRASDLKAQGAMAALLKDALSPNLVQTLEGTPALVHGGPFANIAHGCNSVMATKLALKLGDIVVTEAGFGADLGAEKFLDIKCRAASLTPSAVVLVATVRALKHHGGVSQKKLSEENVAAVEAGLPNLLRHLENLTQRWGLPVVVAINRFPTDTPAEIEALCSRCVALGATVALSEVWEKGGAGGMELAKVVLEACSQPNRFQPLYPLEDSMENKIGAVVRQVYRGVGVEFTPEARKQLTQLAPYAENLPVCIAKTQYSFSDTPQLTCAPEGFKVTVRGLRLSAGAGFVVALTGYIMTMPGLPKAPAAQVIDVDAAGRVTGLF